jgi:hypothetical protein
MNCCACAVTRCTPGYVALSRVRRGLRCSAGEGLHFSNTLQPSMCVMHSCVLLQLTDLLFVTG